ncbi:COX15/CtaA family protein [Nocardioides sp. 1609]|uniref:COX15/CtaA family protein n=1 Tax=Nocardioides sp. 1609 TaxID=2508327 RepID=UPI00106F1DE1|nr:COX15/CtaA family protein [Nocardioides sp. 1609]
MGVKVLDRLARLVRPLGWASLVANIAIVVTGGAVRLTGSGLGCPTWPRCTDESFRPHGELELHSAIEFGNRMLTFVLAAIAIATFLAAWRTGRRQLRVLALVLALGVPFQAVIGGITVLADLNPWIVSLHLLLSMAMVGVAVLFLRRIDDPGAVWTRGRTQTLAWITFAATWVVLYLGTIVTGAGPHAGDAETPRNGLDPLQISQLHADSVFLLVGLTVGLLLATRAGTAARRAAVVLLGVELGQSVIGFVQYFTDLPEILVGAHMLGAGVISATATGAVLAVVLRPAPSAVPAVPATPAPARAAR